jgi:YHS domain-containing protein
MRIFSLMAVTGGLLIAGPAAEAQAPKVVVNAKSGLALEGYDPVTYFTEAAPVKGNATFSTKHLGVTYYFVSADHRDRFSSEPAKYAPQFGGYFGYGASRGYLASVDPEAYTIMNGRLILQNSKRVLELWKKEPDAWLKLADPNWPAIVAREGKPFP